VAILLSVGPPIDNYGTLQFEAAAEIVTVGKNYTEGKIAEIKENWGDALAGAPPQSPVNRVSWPRTFPAGPENVDLEGFLLFFHPDAPSPTKSSMLIWVKEPPAGLS